MNETNVENNEYPFYTNELIGSSVETRLWRILADSGYNVIHFFKEQVDELQQVNRTWEGNETVQRLRSAPDLYVTISDTEQRESAKHQTHFVEVKFRNPRSPERVQLEDSKQLERQLKFWHDTVLVIFIPKERFWYAQQLELFQKKISEAAQNGKPVEFNLSEEFKPLTEFFPQIKAEKLSGFTKPLVHLMKTLRPLRE